MINWLEQHLFTCFFKHYFGIDCLGCGMQRAAISLLKGNLTESIKYNAGLLPLVATLLLLLMQLKIKYINGGQWVMWAFIITTIITVVQFIAKQVLFYL
jgi:phosphoglycerol transferase MdoB-like AlkP superfamily enzyme